MGQPGRIGQKAEKIRGPPSAQGPGERLHFLLAYRVISGEIRYRVGETGCGLGEMARAVWPNGMGDVTRAMRDRRNNLRKPPHLPNHFAP